MSKVYTSIIRPVIANTFLLGFFDFCVFQNLHCDEKSSMMQSNVSTVYLFIYRFICLFNICLFDWFYSTSKTGFEFLEHISLSF